MWPRSTQQHPYDEIEIETKEIIENETKIETYRLVKSRRLSPVSFIDIGCVSSDDQKRVSSL